MSDGVADGSALIEGQQACSCGSAIRGRQDRRLAELGATPVDERGAVDERLVDLRATFTEPAAIDELKREHLADANPG